LAATRYNPGGELRPSLEGAQALEDPQKGLLHRLLGVRGIADDAVGHREHTTAVLLHEHAKRFFLARLGAGNDGELVFVHRWL